MVSVVCAEKGHEVEDGKGLLKTTITCVSNPNKVSTFFTLLPPL